MSSLRSILFIGNSYTFGHDMPHIVAELAANHPEAANLHCEWIAQGGVTLEWHTQNVHTFAQLHKRSWDTVVLQEHSLRPVASVSRMLAAGECLASAVRENGARSCLFLTWARAHRPAMLHHLENSYRELARRIQAPVVPVGAAWAAAMKLPESIRPVLYEDDRSHPTFDGSYLTACVFFCHLTGHSCRNLPYRGKPASPAAQTLQQIAEETVAQSAKDFA